MYHVQGAEDSDERFAASDYRTGDRRPHQQCRRRRSVVQTNHSQSSQFISMIIDIAGSLASSAVFCACDSHHAVYTMSTKAVYNEITLTNTGRAKKRNPLGKIRYLLDCSIFYAKFTVLTEEDSDDIFCKFYCNIWLHSKIVAI